MRHLSGKEKKQLKEIIPKGYEIDKKDEVIEENNILYKNKNKYLIKIDDIFIPHLNSVIEDKYPICYIDNGAIPFLLRGADMMRPGIEKIQGEFEKGEIILIKNLNYPKVIGISQSLLSSEEMKSQEKGKSLKVLHYLKDQYT